MVRTLTPTVTLTDAIGLGISRFITEATTAVDALTRRIVALRELAAGSGGYTSTGYVSSGYLTDNATTIVETLAKQRDVPRALSQTTTITGIIANLGIGRFITTQASTFTETLGRTYNAMRTASGALTVTEVLARALVASRTLTQTVTITELLTTFKGIAGVGARRVKEATAFLVKRSGITNIFKRSGTTST